MRNRHCRWWLVWSLIVPVIFCLYTPWLFVVGLIMAGLSIEWRRVDKPVEFHALAGFAVSALGSLPLLLTSAMPGGIIGYLAFNVSLALVSIGMTYEPKEELTQSTEPDPGNYSEYTEQYRVNNYQCTDNSVDTEDVVCEIWENGRWVPLERVK